jgi:taurine dioxygenase
VKLNNHLEIKIMIERKLNIVTNDPHQPLTPNFGLRVDLKDVKSIDIEQANYYKNLLYKNKVLIFKNVELSTDEYLKFAKLFGEPVKFVDIEYRHPEYPEIFVVSNVKKDGKKFGMDRVGYYWHSDSSFMPEPLPITMLYSQIVPSAGGQTAFIDMSSVYKSIQSFLPDNFDNMVSSHEGKWRYLITKDDVGFSIEEILERDEREVPSQIHPLVIIHPITKQKALYFSQGITKHILDMDENKSKELIAKISDGIESESARYQHQWQEKEMVMWDNRSVVHRAFPSQNGEGRMMFRIGVKDQDFFANSR